MSEDVYCQPVLNGVSYPEWKKFSISYNLSPQGHILLVFFP